MMYFDYRAKAANSNKVFRGVVTSDTQASAIENLKSKGLTIVEITPMADFLSIRKTFHSFTERITKKTVLEFFEQLSFMLNTDISLYEALTILRDNGASKKIKALSRPLADGVRKGLSLHEAMESVNYFSVTTVQQVKSGEESGNVPDTLKRVAAEMAREMEFKKKIKSAMTYPIIICVVMVIVLWVLMTLVVPSISETIIGLGGELPTITKIVIAVSNGMRKTTPLFIMLVIAAVGTYKFMCRNKEFKCKADRIKIKIPLVGKIIEKLELSRFCKNLSTMQESGIPLVHSLAITQNSLKNTYIRRMVEKSANLISQNGLDLSLGLKEGSKEERGKFPELMLQLIEVGVNTGKISEVLSRISEQYQKEIDDSVKKITSMIEPAMIIVVGILAGTVVISMFLPLMSIMDTF